MNNRRLDVVDFLRGFSIFTIVLMHLVQSFHLPGFLQKATSLVALVFMYLYCVVDLDCICLHYINHWLMGNS